MQVCFSLYCPEKNSENKDIQIIETVNNLIVQLNNLALILKNIHQDVTTFKMVATNMKLDNNHIHKNKIETGGLEVLIHKTDSAALLIQSKISELKVIQNLISEYHNHFQKDFTHTRKYFNSRLKILHSAMLHIGQIHDETESHRLVFEEKTRSSSASISNIITNLQYHDIIRQKIDHIKDTHLEILNELKTLEPTIENKNEMFKRIGDITIIQGAQLIHANKEYQDAIEGISRMFLQVKEDSSKIALLCQNLHEQNNNEETYHLKELIKNLRQLVNSDTSNSRYSEIIIGSISTFITSTQSSMSVMTDIKTIFSELESRSTIDYKNCELCARLDQKFNKLDSISKNINSLLEILGKFSGSYEDMMADFTVLSNKIELLEQRNTEIQELIAKNTSLSLFISDEITRSLDEIEYYDFFQKVIEEVVKKLDHINFKLYAASGIEFTDKVNLDFMKQKYTMASEYQIHDQITKNRRDDKDDLIIGEIDQDDENLELF